MLGVLEGTPLGDELEKRGIEENPVKKLFELMYDEDCKKDPECEEVVCECGGFFETVFGSVPLLIKCNECGNTCILRDLVKEL